MTPKQTPLWIDTSDALEKALNWLEENGYLDPEDDNFIDDGYSEEDDYDWRI